MSKFLRPFGLLLLGITVGIFSATLGSGGGSIIVPGLTLIFGYKIKEIVGSSLSLIVLTTLMGATTHYLLNENSILFLVVGLVFMGSIIGAKIGSSWTYRIRSWILMYLSAAILIFAGLKLLGIVNVPTDIVTAATSPYLLAALGLFTGFLSALLGIGAGVILVPVLNLFFGIPIHTAIPTALAVISPTTFGGAIFHHNLGKLNLKLLKCMIPGLLIGAVTGAFISQQLSETTLKIILGIYVLVSAIQMILTSDIKPKRGHIFFEPPKRWWQFWG